MSNCVLIALFNINETPEENQQIANLEVSPKDKR